MHTVGGPGGRGGPGARRGAGGPASAPKAPPAKPIFPSLGNLFMRSQASVTVFGFLPVVPMVLGSALLMILFSLLTKPPTKETIERYFPASEARSDEPALAAS